eukprot:scaffold91096_cov62-Phaeocystis_antarctica.AAC.7
MLLTVSRLILYVNTSTSGIAAWWWSSGSPAPCSSTPVSVACRRSVPAAVLSSASMAVARGERLEVAAFGNHPRYTRELTPCCATLRDTARHCATPYWDAMARQAARVTRPQATESRRREGWRPLRQLNCSIRECPCELHL